MTHARLAEISLPDFGMADVMPRLPDAVYRDRLERLRTRADEQGYDHLVVYADREHSANLAYLTGFDPRFEEAVRRMTPAGAIENAAHLLISAADGLRVINEVEQLAAFEYAACRTSLGVRQLLFGLQPGMRECDAVRLLEWNGMPLSCHLMLSSGDRASLGLLSPSDRRIERGDRFTVAFGIWGALNCRAGFVVEDAAELPVGINDYVERLVGPYFEAVAAWYGALRIGQTGGPSTRSSTVTSATRSSASSSTPAIRSTSTSG